MLTGLYPPTAGGASIAGYDIVKDIDNVHKHLGICLQVRVDAWLAQPCSCPALLRSTTCCGPS